MREDGSTGKKPNEMVTQDVRQAYHFTGMGMWGCFFLFSNKAEKSREGQQPPAANQAQETRPLPPSASA